MRLGSSLSAVAKPFQPQATSSSTLVAGPPRGPAGPAGPREDSPAAAAIGTPVRRGSPVSPQTQMREKPLLTPPSRTGRLGGDVPEEEIEVAIAVATQMIATPQL